MNEKAVTGKLTEPFDSNFLYMLGMNALQSALRRATNSNISLHSTWGECRPTLLRVVLCVNSFQALNRSEVAHSGMIDPGGRHGNPSIQ